MDLELYPSFLIGGDGIPLVSEADWELAPGSMRMVVIAQHGRLEIMEKRKEQLEGSYRKLQQI